MNLLVGRRVGQRKSKYVRACSRYLPSLHLGLTHIIASFNGPLQGFPFVFGLGLLHCLERVFFPSLQLREQALHVDHSAQLPSILTEY